MDVVRIELELRDSDIESFLAVVCLLTWFQSLWRLRLVG